MPPGRGDPTVGRARTADDQPDRGGAVPTHVPADPASAPDHPASAPDHRAGGHLGPGPVRAAHPAHRVRGAASASGTTRRARAPIAAAVPAGRRGVTVLRPGRRGPTMPLARSAVATIPETSRGLTNAIGP